MADERQAMYDGFSDTSKHSTKWVWITKEFLKLAFAGGQREVSCPCSRCDNRRMLSEYEMSAHLAKKGFMSNYLLWHQHREVQPTVADESDGNDDVNRMDNMVADIGWGYDRESEDPPLEVQNFYGLLAASEEKVNDGTDVTVLQALTHLMAFKSMYNFSN
jgi:phage terminase large subunit GpA-like protein